MSVKKNVALSRRLAPTRAAIEASAGVLDNAAVTPSMSPATTRRTTSMNGAAIASRLTGSDAIDLQICGTAASQDPADQVPHHIRREQHERRRASSRGSRTIATGLPAQRRRSDEPPD